MAYAAGSKSTRLALGSFTPDCPLPYWTMYFHCLMAHYISFGIETLAWQRCHERNNRRGILFCGTMQVIGSVMGVVLGGPFRCSLHRFLYSRYEILGVLQDTEGLVLEMRHSMQVVHLGRQQIGQINKLLTSWVKYSYVIS